MHYLHVRFNPGDIDSQITFYVYFFLFHYTILTYESFSIFFFILQFPIVINEHLANDMVRPKVCTFFSIFYSVLQFFIFCFCLFVCHCFVLLFEVKDNMNDDLKTNDMHLKVTVRLWGIKERDVRVLCLFESEEVLYHMKLIEGKKWFKNNVDFAFVSLRDNKLKTCFMFKLPLKKKVYSYVSFDFNIDHSPHKVG